MISPVCAAAEPHLGILDRELPTMPSNHFPSWSSNVLLVSLRNHAQALYASQALATRNSTLRAHFERASAEETDHLA